MSDNPPIEYDFPDIRRWEKGDAPYIHVRDSGKPGPTVMLAALTHGNEVSGAIVVDELLGRGLKPRKGKLIFSFNNFEAYQRFDPKNPFKSRMIDEDFNRTWGRLDQPATTRETRRAQVEVDPIKRAAMLIKLNELAINNIVVIPVVARLGVAAVKDKLVVELGGWDNNTWNLANWYREA